MQALELNGETSTLKKDFGDDSFRMNQPNHREGLIGFSA